MMFDMYEEIYNKYIGKNNWVSRREVYWRQILEATQDFCEIKDSKFLDVGTDFGFLCFMLTDMGAKTVGMDISKGRIIKCKMIAGEYHYDLDNPIFIAGDIENYDYRHKVDYIYLLNVLHHLGLFRGDVRTWNIFNRLLEHSKAVFVMTRLSWTRTIRGKRTKWLLCKGQDNVGEAIINKSDATWSKDLGRIQGLYSGRRHLWIVGK